jgi:hypothetical protein
MERWDKDTYDAIIWVRNNRDLFRMEVFETPYMRLSVKDQKYTNAVEACFNANQLKVSSLFIFQQETSSLYLLKDFHRSVQRGRRYAEQTHQ